MLQLAPGRERGTTDNAPVVKNVVGENGEHPAGTAFGSDFRVFRICSIYHWKGVITVRALRIYSDNRAFLQA